MKYKNIVITIITMCTICLTTINIVASEKAVIIESIFNDNDGIWHPGRSESKGFYIINNNNYDISIDRLYIKLNRLTHLELNKELDKKSINFKELGNGTDIKLTYKDKELFNDKLVNILDKDSIKLPQYINIKSKQKQLLNMSIKIDKNLKNEAQSLEGIFNIGVRYRADDMESTHKINLQSLKNHSHKFNDKFYELPQTGGIINSMTLSLIGIILIAIGIFLNKKLSK